MRKSDIIPSHGTRHFIFHDDGEVGGGEGQKERATEKERERQTEADRQTDSQSERLMKTQRLID